MPRQATHQTKPTAEKNPAAIPPPLASAMLL